MTAINHAPVEGLNTSSRTHFNLVFVLLIVTTAALGGLLFGYDWVVIGGAKPFYERYFQLQSAFAVGWANSSALLGCLLGSLLSGTLSDGIGRKKMLVAGALLFAVSSLFTGWSYHFYQFVTWRILGGIAIGIASNLSPTYVSEVSPAQWRGRLVAIYQLGIAVGVVMAQIVNWMIAQDVPKQATSEAIRLSWNGQYGWRWMFSAVAIPALVFFVGSLIIPESPRWLALRGSSAEAEMILSRIGGQRFAQDTLASIHATAEAEGSKLQWRNWRHSGMIKIVVIGAMLAILQQFSGINVIYNYAEEIYTAAGYGISGVMLNIIATGSVSMLSTVLALLFVDKIGRRPLMLFGCLSLALFHALIGASYFFGCKGALPLILTLCAIGCYGLSLAPVTWILISELFPNQVRGVAIAISVSALWIACFALTYTFPIIISTIGLAGSFSLYAGICLAGFFFVRHFVPETRGKSLEQIEQEIARVES